MNLCIARPPPNTKFPKKTNNFPAEVDYIWTIQVFCPSSVAISNPISGEL